jgi:hypothetical protein
MRDWKGRKAEKERRSSEVENGSVESRYGVVSGMIDGLGLAC